MQDSSFSRKGTGKMLGVFGLVMINVIAVDSLRTLPAGAVYGFSLITFYLLAGLLFFIPTALITAELATAWPNTGGVYIWVRTAFGRNTGLFAIWLQWIYNVVWYPTILSFIAATFAYLLSPQLAHNKIYILSTILGVWWLATIVNCLGLKISAWVSTLGAIIGTLIPMALITVLATIWLSHDKPTTVTFSFKELIPNLTSFNNLAFFTAVIFGLMGLEMSAVHAGDVHHPERNYPRALLWSASIILATLMLASLAIAVVVPHDKLSVLSGLTDAYDIFFRLYHLNFCIPIIIALIVLGSFSGVSAWVIGPTRGLLVALKENGVGLPWQKINKHGMPVKLLILQGIIVTVLSSVFVLLPTVSGAYWALSAMTAQLAVLFYILMFTAAIRLRHKHSTAPRAYRIPGGNWGMWLVAGAGIFSCIITFALGFAPPTGIQIGSIWSFEAILLGGIFAFCVLPFFIYFWSKSRTFRKTALILEETAK